jgi:hypothetical protein
MRTMAMRRGFMLLLMTVLAGCASRVPLDREAAGRIEQIGVVTPAVPDGPTSLIRMSPGLQFGLIGAVADGLLQLERERQLKEVLAARGFDVSARWQAILGETLGRAGFAVVAVPVARPDARFAANYPPAEVDALLDVVVTGYGYQASTILAPFHPALRMRTRLASPQGRTLMEEQFEVGPETALGLGEFTFIASGPRHAFNTSAEKPADPDRVVAGVEEAMREIALRIAEALRPAAATSRLSAR